MELNEAMSTLRAVRRLKPDPLPDEVLQRLLQAAAWAPTGGNVQPWRIVAVRDAAARARIGALYKDEWQTYAAAYRRRQTSAPLQVQERAEKMASAGDYLAEHMHEAPVLLMVCFNPQLMAITDADLGRPSVVGGGSVYTAVQNLMLACVQEGLGCVLTTLLCYREAEVKEVLGLPDDWFTCACVPVGYPVLKGHGPIRRRPVEKMVYADRWGEAWHS